MPFNSLETLKAHFHEDRIKAEFDFEGEASNALDLALEQSADFVHKMTGEDIPEAAAEADKTLQKCDAYIFAFFNQNLLVGKSEEDNQRTITMYREIMKVLQVWNTMPGKEGGSLAESKRTNWFEPWGGGLS